MKNVAPDATAMNPSMRTGVMSLSCGIVWDGGKERQPEEDLAKIWSQKILA